MNGPRLGATLVLVAGLAFAGGVWVGMRPGPSASETVGRTAGPPPAVDACPPCDDGDLASCQQQLAVATGILDAQQREAVGTPVPFPDDLPDAYRPETFEANVRRGLQECPGTGLELAFVDCSEYPCFAWFGGDDVWALRRCPWWAERYTNPAIDQASGSLITATGERRYTGLGERPPGGHDPLDDNAMQRFQLRNQEAVDLLQEAWDARELTDQERDDRMVGFWRERAQAGDEGAERMLEMLEAEE